MPSFCARSEQFGAGQSENPERYLYASRGDRDTVPSLFIPRTTDGAVHAQELELAAVRFGTLDHALEF